MSKEFFDAVKAIEAEKGIPAEYLYEKISAAIIVAAKHDYNGKDIVHCDIDPEKQKIKVYVRKMLLTKLRTRTQTSLSNRLSLSERALKSAAQLIFRLKQRISAELLLKQLSMLSVRVSVRLKEDR